MMPTRDVPRNQWTEFLDSFSRRHRAWLTTVEQSGEAFGRSASAEAPLGSVRATRDGRGTSAIEIAFAGDGHVPLRIENPSTVRVQQGGDGAERGLEIVNDEGVSTRVEFRSGARPEMLDGLAPGEA